MPSDPYSFIIYYTAQNGTHNVGSVVYNPKYIPIYNVYIMLGLGWSVGGWIAVAVAAMEY